VSPGTGCTSTQEFTIQTPPIAASSPIATSSLSALAPFTAATAASTAGPFLAASSRAASSPLAATSALAASSYLAASSSLAASSYLAAISPLAAFSLAASSLAAYFPRRWNGCRVVGPPQRLHTRRFGREGRHRTRHPCHRLHSRRRRSRHRMGPLGITGGVRNRPAGGWSTETCLLPNMWRAGRHLLCASAG